MQSFAFHKPVNKKFVKDYYDVIKKPMDLDTLSKVLLISLLSAISLMIVLLTYNIGDHIMVMVDTKCCCHRMSRLTSIGVEKIFRMMSTSST